MKTVVVVPYRPHPHRDPLWEWVQKWIAEHYNYPVFQSDSDSNYFSAAAARNKAARLAGDWDAALIHDADTIAHPQAVQAALTQAVNTGGMVVTADAHMYCDPISTARMMAEGPMFPRPNTFDANSLYERPSGGIVAISRECWERTGGYVESLVAWGFEDLVFLHQCNLFAGGHGWVRGHINLHLYHPPAPRTADTRFNEQVWRTLADYRVRDDQRGAREYLAQLGHTTP